MVVEEDICVPDDPVVCGRLKFGLLKGYWQVPLSACVREISAFVTPTGLYKYTLMSFGLRNAPATF